MFSFSSFLRNPAGLLAGSLLALASCTHTGDPGPGPGNPGPGGSAAYTVSGVALDTNGQPIAEALVRAENDVTHSWAEVHTDASGHYAMPKLEFGGWKIYAWKEAAYKGQTYYLRLGMPSLTDYDAFSTSAQGTVKNFQWRLSGRIPDRPASAYSGAGYFGGALRCVILDSNFDTLPEGSEVTVIFTPVAGAALLDGRAPQVVRKSFTVVHSSPAQYSYWVQDVPQCEYRITAENRLSGTTRALTVSSNNLIPYPAAIASDYFKTSGGTSYESGLGEGQIPAIYLR